MTRRELLRAAAAGFFATRAVRTAAAESIQTVTGSVAPDALGVVLPHEHVLVDFIGADRVSPDRYDRTAAFEKALPHLRRLVSLGCRTLVECTPAFIGRDPVLLRDLAKATGLHILTNTGYYGAANDKFLPPHAFTESASVLAARWIREAREGIDGTGIRPAFMKIGVDAGPLSEVDGKLVDAAAQTTRETGLPIWSHTGDGVAAMAQIERLARHRVPLSRFVWVHAQNEKDPAVHARAASRGAWVSFDGLSEASFDRHVELILEMRRRGLLGRLLVSHDAGWYHVGEPDGGTYRPHDLLFTDGLPALRKHGLTDAEIRQLIEENPQRAIASS